MGEEWWLAWTVLVFIGSFGHATAKGDVYTAQELQLLPELRERVKAELRQDYMFEDKFLVRYLRARDWDINKAEESVLDLLKWRKQERIDEVLDEDFTWWKQAFPFYFPVDKYGRPGLATATSLANLDLRKYVLSGKTDQIRRYIYYVSEIGLRNLQRVTNETGVEFVNGHLIANLAGYSNRIHACVACLPYWIETAQSYERYYPQLASTMIGVNAPRLFEVLVNFIRPFISPFTQKAVRLYSFDRHEWEQELFKLFPRSELTIEFGGTRKPSEYQIMVSNFNSLNQSNQKP